MPKPVCVKCQRFYRMKRGGVTITEGMPKPGENRAVPGTSEAAKWQPYKIWQADLWHCQGCGHELISGFGREPVAQRRQDKFAKWLEVSEYTVNDC